MIKKTLETLKQQNINLEDHRKMPVSGNVVWPPRLLCLYLYRVWCGGYDVWCQLSRSVWRLTRFLSGLFISSWLYSVSANRMDNYNQLLLLLHSTSSSFQLHFCFKTYDAFTFIWSITTQQMHRCMFVSFDKSRILLGFECLDWFIVLIHSY